MNLNPAPAPEGVLDPQQPWWPTANMRDSSWEILKAKLTGRRMPDGTQYETWVRLSDGDADRLIANIKKYGKYPQVNQKGNLGGYENLEAYQKWLVEEFLEKPFRDETNKKIEDAETESRIKEIREKAKKDKESVPLDRTIQNKEEDNEQEELDQSQEKLVSKLDNITEDIDSIDDDSEKKESTASESSEPEKNDDAEPQDNNDFSDIKDSLEEIKGSLQIQASDLASINQNDAGSIGALEALKQLFQTQNDILRKQVENAKKQTEESALEQSQQTSGTSKGTDLTADNKAEGIIQGIDGEVITVKTTEGQFRQGEKISQGDGGGGLFGMLKGIAGKFLGGKGGAGGGGGSPIKMSSGGFLNTSYPAMAEGGISPGIYNKPTRGNLLPGQAVIPLNRNVGKKLLKDGGRKNTKKFDQPLVDVMSQPLKAIGLSIISVAGNFIRALGPLGGFFLPYAKGLVKGFAAVLGVPVTLIMSLLGGPAYAAVEQQDKQQNIFAKLWDNLMKTFGFNFGDEETADKKKKNQTGDNGPENFEGSENAEKAFNYFKSKGLTPEQSAGIVGNLMQESGHGLDPKAHNDVAGGHHGIAQWDTADRWNGFVNGKSFAGKKWEGVGEDGKFKLENQLRYIYWEIETGAGGMSLSTFKNAKTVEQAASDWVNKYERSGEVAGTEGFDNRVKNAKGILAKYNVSAESGVQIKVKDDQSMGKMLGWSVVRGPNAGYDVNSNLEMHGEEAYLQYEKGFTILPIENNKYSLSKNPMATLDRWKEILGPNNTVNVNGEYETGGKQVFDPKKYSGNARSSRYIPIGQGNNAKSYVVMYERQGASGTVIVKAISKRVSGDDLIGVNPSSKEWNQVLNSANTKEELFFDIAQSLKKELKTDKDAGTYYAYNQAFQTTKNAWLKKGFSQKDAETYAAAAAKEFALTRNSGSWLPGSRNGLDPSLKEVEVSSGDTSSSSSSGEPDSDFQLMEKAFSAMIVGAGLMAAQPKNKEEYDTLKAQFESAFKVTTPTTVTADSNAPAQQQTTTAHPSPTPVIAPPHPASTVTTPETLTQPTMQEQLCQWSAIYYA